MYLKASRKKKRTNNQFLSPFPVKIDDKNDWTIYTAHLGVSNACVVDPQEMTAIHSMGFFGKGTLSRNLPVFGKRYFGVPPPVRDRQWKRREEWLEEVTNLHSEIFPLPADRHENETLTESNVERNLDESMEVTEITEENFNSNKTNNNKIVGECSKASEKVPEIVLDSTEVEEDEEEDDVCEIVYRTNTNDDEVCTLDDECINLPLKPDEYVQHLYDFSEGKQQINADETLVLPDSDSDDENYLTNIKPRIETKGFPPIETLQLTFEETFFLMYGLGCLQLVNHDGKLLSILDAWNHFNTYDKLFLPRYVVYHYFRSKGWVVKPGLKFGSDYLLYKQGPTFYHASYMVNVETVDKDTLIRDENRSTHKLTWNNLLQINRLSEITAKEFLIAQVLWPSNIPIQSNSVALEALSGFTVRELLWRRWKPTQTEELIALGENDESDDEDSS